MPGNAGEGEEGGEKVGRGHGGESRWLRVPGNCSGHRKGDLGEFA